MLNRIKLAVFWFARGLGLFALFRMITRSRIRVLCYHGGAIGDEFKYNRKLFISAETLHSRMQWLVDNKFNIISLGEATDLLNRTEDRPHLPTVITFDDGWYSTGSELLPVMARFSMPSTLYLCTKHYEEGWPVLDVVVGYIIWQFGEQHIRISGFEDALDGLYDTRNTDLRNKLCVRTVQWLSRIAHTRNEICTALEKFAACGGVSADTLALDSRRFEYMSRDMLFGLEVQGCEVELHGHIHRYPVGDSVELHQDLLRCGQIIEEIGLPAPKHYCYPSGKFDMTAVPVLRALDIKSATTCVPGMINSVSGDARFFLPRFLDGESISDLEFEAELSGFAPLFRSFVRRR